MLALVADIGGTRIKLGVVQDRAMLVQSAIEARSHEGLGPQLPRIVQALNELCRKVNVEFDDCDALGVAFPSLVDVRSARVLTSFGKYVDAPQLDLRRWAKEAFDLPLMIDNDVRVAQLGEWQAGAGRGSDDFAMATVGTGLGTSAIMGGRLVRGRHGQAAILGGHQTVRLDGEMCVCGNRGCAEMEAALSSLSRIARREPTFASSDLRTFQNLDYATVFRLARERDPCALALLAHSLEVWTALLVSLIHSFDPERIVIGGGVLTNAGDVLAELKRLVHARCHTPWGSVEILPAQLGDAAALIGAGVMVGELITDASGARI